MKNLIIFFLAVLALGADAQQFKWASHIGGNGSHYVGGTVVDAKGNIYITGEFNYANVPGDSVC